MKVFQTIADKMAQFSQTHSSESNCLEIEGQSNGHQ